MESGASRDPIFRLGSVAMRAAGLLFEEKLKLVTLQCDFRSGALLKYQNANMKTGSREMLICYCPSRASSSEPGGITLTTEKETSQSFVSKGQRRNRGVFTLP